MWRGRNCFFAHCFFSAPAFSIRIAPAKVISLTKLNDGGITLKGLAAILDTYSLCKPTENWKPKNKADFDLLFKKTKLAKNWRIVAIREDSEYGESLKEEEDFIDES